MISSVNNSQPRHVTPAITSPVRHEATEGRDAPDCWKRSTSTGEPMSVSIHPDQDDEMLGPLDSCASSARIPAWRSAAVRPRMAARSWREADPATGQIVCLRLTGQLCGGTAQALLDAVGARVCAAVPPPCAV